MAMPFHSCTTTKKMADNQREEGHFRLYSFPEKLPEYNSDPDRFKKIILVSSNDFDGNIQPRNFVIKNKFQDERIMRVGGLSAMRAYTDILKKTYPNQVLHVDSGSFLHKSQNHLETIFMYNYLNVDVANLGLNEFSLASDSKKYIEYINSLTSKARFNIIASNLFDLRKARTVNWKNVKTSYIQTINDVKIGFIGITPQSLAKKIDDNKINGIHIQNEAKNIIEKTNYLRRKGAQVILLMTSDSMDCTSQTTHETGIHPEKVNFNPHESEQCDLYNSNLLKTLTLVPKNSIDAIITSGSKSKVANFINGFPVLQNPGEGRYLSWMELYFDTNHSTIVKNKTIIHQPILLCHSFFKSTEDCYTNEKFDEEDLIPAMFLGTKVEVKPTPKF